MYQKTEKLPVPSGWWMCIPPVMAAIPCRQLRVMQSRRFSNKMLRKGREWLMRCDLFSVALLYSYS